MRRTAGCKNDTRQDEIFAWARCDKGEAGGPGFAFMEPHLQRRQNAW